MATIAELAVNFTADTSKAEHGLNRVTSLFQRFKTESEKTAYTANQEFGKVSKALEAVGVNGGALAGTIGKVGLAMAGLSAGASLAVLISQFDKSVQSAAHLQDMSEKTGASIEKLSAISTIAKIQGTDMDMLSGAMVKLAANMDATGGPSKSVADALARIGLSARDLKGLDTGSMFEVISRRMGEYGDSAGKTAVAVTLLGKRGAELIPTMNLLAESGSLVARTTAEQAMQADAYEKNVQRLQLSKDALYKTISLALLLSVNAFVSAMIDVNNETDGVRKTVKGLAEDGTLKEWSVASGYALAGLADGFGYVGKAALTVAMTISTPLSSMFQFINGNVEESANKIFAFRARMDELWGGKSFVTRFSENLEKPAPNAAPVKQGVSGGNAGSAADSGGDNFLKGLQTRIDKADQGEYAMLRLQAAQNGVLQAAGPLIEKLKMLDETRMAKSYEDSLTKQVGDAEFQLSLVGKTATQIEALNIQHRNTLELQRQINEAERTRGSISEETVVRMTKANEEATARQISLLETRKNAESSWSFGSSKAMQQYVTDSENYAKMSEQVFSKAFAGMEDSLVQFVMTGKMDFNSLANSIISDIIRVMIRAMIVGPIVKALTGGMGGEGGLAGGIASLLGFKDGGAFSGGQQITAFANGGVVSKPTLFPMANGAGLMGEAGPEAVMPLTRDSSGRLGVRSASGNGNVSVQIINQATADGYQATATQKTDENGRDMIQVIVEKVKGAMTQDVRSNGQFSQLLANKYGLRGTM